MKNYLMLIQDKIALRKKALIESVNDELKNMYEIEHCFASSSKLSGQDIGHLIIL